MSRPRARIIYLLGKLSFVLIGLVALHLKYTYTSTLPCIYCEKFFGASERVWLCWVLSVWCIVVSRMRYAFLKYLWKISLSHNNLHLISRTKVVFGQMLHVEPKKLLSGTVFLCWEWQIAPALSVPLPPYSLYLPSLSTVFHFLKRILSRCRLEFMRGMRIRVESQMAAPESIVRTGGGTTMSS